MRSSQDFPFAFFFVSGTVCRGLVTPGTKQKSEAIRSVVIGRGQPRPSSTADEAVRFAGPESSTLRRIPREMAMQRLTRIGVSVCVGMCIPAVAFAQRDAAGGPLTGPPVLNAPVWADAITTVWQTLSLTSREPLLGHLSQPCRRQRFSSFSTSRAP
jgi:hypothetical protein